MSGESGDQEMNQNDRRRYLIEELLEERPEYENMQIPSDADEQKMLLRSLMNIRMPKEIDPAFLQIQDAYLSEENEKKGIVTLADIREVQPDLYIWKGDITRLRVGAIVNAANSGMTGCYHPCHNCIDNCIHTYAGIQLRNYCNDMMIKQGQEEPTGQAKITPAFNLPCEHVIHTVGPIVQGRLTKEHERLLISCYESCLRIADENEATSIAFCCISTGVFMYKTQNRNNEAALKEQVAADLNLNSDDIVCNYITSRVQEKYSVSHQEMRVYNHRLYEMYFNYIPDKFKKDNFEVNGKHYYWMTIEEMEKDDNIKEKNLEVVDFVKEYIK